MIRVADLEVDTAAREVRRGGRLLDLTLKEYAILEILARNKERIVSREAILEGAYDFAAEMSSNVIDVYIGRLRKKLQVGQESRLLHTRRGFGYMLGEKDS